MGTISPITYIITLVIPNIHLLIKSPWPSEVGAPPQGAAPLHQLNFTARVDRLCGLGTNAQPRYGRSHATPRRRTAQENLYLHPVPKPFYILGLYWDDGK